MSRSKIRISHNHPVTDFAPGVLNVVSRSVLTNVNYYKPETFHSSPFYDEVIPLLIQDIFNSESLASIYGHDSVRLERKGVIMINNHPLRRVRVLGCVIDYHERTLNDIAYYIFTLDDYTGVTITGKIPTNEIYTCDFRDMFVMVIGCVKCRSYGRDKEMDIEKFRIVPVREYHGELFQFWKDTFKFKKILNTPWYQSPQINSNPIVVHNARQLEMKRRQQMENVQLFENHEDGSEEFLIVDSQVYTKDSKAVEQDGDESDDTSAAEEEEEQEQDVIIDDEDMDTDPDGSLVLDDEDESEEQQIEREISTYSTPGTATDSFSDITFNLFTTLPIFKPLNLPNETWHQITHYDMNKLLKLTPAQDLTLALFKNTIRHLSNNLDISELLSNIKIKHKLKILLNTGIIDLDDDTEHMKSISELYHDKLIQILESLSPLIEDSTNATNLLLLFQDLESHLKSLRFKRVKLQSKLYLNHYNSVRSGSSDDMNMDIEVLNQLIYWYFVNERDSEFWYVNESMEWCFIDDSVRKGRVLKVRR
ncbi:hypothetical protein WICPIJ_003985 [Wickerhamomyces pijperi]|uniref:CST complex subunit Stn1 N-terminal domain-containing protein n=1 Tax=Wickerhamomyces pijperi TaxID=599730 RepID=A0A9P8Q6J7_WICPI|nr:hypothetical protein WICPIJ_003985 [Wickerhamomyces pijperi]